jgi:hypothetical protein
MVDGKVVRLIPPSAQTAKSVIEMLEEALRRAEAGDIASAALCYTTKDGGVGTGFSDADHFGALLGAIGLLQYRFATAAEEQD